MTDKTDKIDTANSLSQLYTHASQAQLPDAPPALSAAIMQAAATAAAKTAAQHVQTAVVTLPVLQQAPARLFAALGQTIAHHAQQVLNGLKSVFALPTLRYGLSAMIVAAVGFKVAIVDVPKKLDTAPAAVSAPAAEPAAAGPAPVAARETSVANSSDKRAATASVVDSTIVPTRAESSSQTKSSKPEPDTKGKDNTVANKNVTIAAPTQNDGGSKTNSSAATRLGFDHPVAAPQTAQAPQAPQAFPKADAPLVPVQVPATVAVTTKPAAAMLAPVPAPAAAPAPPVFTSAASVGTTNNSSAVFGASGGATAVANDSLSVGARSSARGNEFAGKKLADDAPTKREMSALTASPAPLPMRTPAPMIAARASSEPTGELSSSIPKELRLRWLIATSRMVNGVAQETCNPQPPDLERVKAWLAAGANANYRPANIANAPTTLVLAQRCGFNEAVALMQKSNP